MPFAGVTSKGGVYCMATPAPGTYELRFSDLRLGCWETSSGPTPAPDPEHLGSLIFYYPKGYSGDSIGMCVEDIVAIVPTD
jgi:hypothetical protein